MYDAVSGQPLPHPIPAAAKTTKPTKHLIKKSSGLVMDGVVKHPAKAKRHHLKAKPQAAKPAAHRTSHTPVPAHRHKPQPSATLMRQAVSKPAHKSHHTSPTVHHDERTAQRLARAQAIKKSHHIQRFPAHHPAHRSVTKKHASLPVEHAPAEAAAPKTHHAAPVHPPAPLSESESLVSNALKNARAHESNQPFTKKPRKRRPHANLAMAAIAILILAGFFVYQNIPNLSMRLAATRAGFSAQLPGYKPSGFTQDKVVSYSPGKVTVSWHSNSDSRAYQLTQQVSNWNSQALADNYLAKNNKQYQTFEANGKTIYIYDNGSATWVNGGVWYQITGQASLNTDQVIRIANSI